MKRRDLIALGVCLAWASAARAQPAPKIYRIGVLESIPLTSNRNFAAFQQGMRELGYVEGKNFVIEYRSVDGHAERFAELMLDLIRIKADIVLVRGTPAALAAKRAGTIPVVMTGNADPVGRGIVASLGHPGGIVTGLTSLVGELGAKRVDIIKEFVPSIGRVGVPTSRDNPTRAGEWREIEQAAKRLGLEARSIEVATAEALTQLFDTDVAGRIDGLLVSANGFNLANRRAIVGLAAKHAVPTIYAARDFVEVGGLMSYGVYYPDMYYRAAGYVDKIRKGAKPGDLPIGQPNKLELVINQKTADSLGLKVPPSLRVRADEVIV